MADSQLPIASNSAEQLSRRHHFVPEFLLRPWSTDGMLTAYSWDSRRDRLNVEKRSPRSVGFELDLLLLESHPQGRDAIERQFFGTVDTHGAEVRDKMLATGAKDLSQLDRAKFVHLLLSLEARRPQVVSKLRVEGRRHFTDGLDTDPAIVRACAENGYTERPSDVAAQLLNINFEGYALSVVQSLTTIPDVGQSLFSAYWDVLRVSGKYDRFIASDRPLIRVKGYSHPRALWAIPLSPTALFVACRHWEPLAVARQLSEHRLVILTNGSTLSQCDRFAFSTDPDLEPWIGKHLGRLKRQVRG